MNANNGLNENVTNPQRMINTVHLGSVKLFRLCRIIVLFFQPTTLLSFNSFPAVLNKTTLHLHYLPCSKVRDKLVKKVDHQIFFGGELVKTKTCWT